MIQRWFQKYQYAVVKKSPPQKKKEKLTANRLTFPNFRFLSWFFKFNFLGPNLVTSAFLHMISESTDNSRIFGDDQFKRKFTSQKDNSSNFGTQQPIFVKRA